jgi:hypothetical protein
MELLEKNRRNVRTETHNADSVSTTRDYEEAIANAESVTALDVGAKLKAYYAYTEEEKRLLVGSKEVVEATGPLPVFMTSWVAAQRLIAATEEATERRKRDADRAKAPHSIRGTLQMGIPHAVAPTSEATITILDIWWRSLFYKIYFPLHWWVDEVIQQYHDHPHLIPKCDITLENGTKVQVIDFPIVEAGVMQPPCGLQNLLHTQDRRRLRAPGKLQHGVQGARSFLRSPQVHRGLEDVPGLVPGGERVLKRDLQRQRFLSCHMGEPLDDRVGGLETGKHAYSFHSLSLLFTF